MEKTEIIKKETEELLKKMIEKFSVDVELVDEIYYVKIKADEEAATVIGKHGETIRSLQKILEVILYKKFKEPANILVNVNDFREKQKERLEKIVEKAINEVLNTKKPVCLKNLSSYERKIVHQTIGKRYPQLVSYSKDFGKKRRLIIELKTDQI